MARYHTLFTSIELAAPFELPPPPPLAPRSEGGRVLRTPRHSVWLGRLGETQLGPTHMGIVAIASLVCGFIAFELIGLNMWASVDW